MQDRPLTAREQDLVTEHFSTARRCAQAFLRKFPRADPAEVESDACLALCMAARHYCPERGPFANFAGACIMSNLRHTRRAQLRRDRGRVSIDNPAELAEVEAETAGQEQSAARPLLAGELEAMRGAVDSLSKKQTLVLAGASMGLSDEEMAVRLGVARKNVFVLRKRGIKKLSAKMVANRSPAGNNVMRDIGHLEGTIGAAPNPV